MFRTINGNKRLVRILPFIFHNLSLVLSVTILTLALLILFRVPVGYRSDQTVINLHRIHDYHGSLIISKFVPESFGLLIIVIVLASLNSIWEFGALGMMVFFKRKNLFALTISGITVIFLIGMLIFCNYSTSHLDGDLLEKLLVDSINKWQPIQ